MPDLQNSAYVSTDNNCHFTLEDVTIEQFQEAEKKLQLLIDHWHRVEDDELNEGSPTVEHYHDRHDTPSMLEMKTVERWSTHLRRRCENPCSVLADDVRAILAQGRAEGMEEAARLLESDEWEHPTRHPMLRDPFPRMACAERIREAIEKEKP